MIEKLSGFVDTILLAGEIFFGLITMLGLIALVGVLGWFIDVGE